MTSPVRSIIAFIGLCLASLFACAEEGFRPLTELNIPSYEDGRKYFGSWVTPEGCVRSMEGRYEIVRCIRDGKRNEVARPIERGKFSRLRLRYEPADFIAPNGEKYKIIRDGHLLVEKRDAETNFQIRTRVEHTFLGVWPREVEIRDIRQREDASRDRLLNLLIQKTRPEDD